MRDTKVAPALVASKASTSTIVSLLAMLMIKTFAAMLSETLIVTDDEKIFNQQNGRFRRRFGLYPGTAGRLNYRLLLSWKWRRCLGADRCVSILRLTSSAVHVLAQSATRLAVRKRLTAEWGVDEQGVLILLLGSRPARCCFLR